MRRTKRKLSPRELSDARATHTKERVSGGAGRRASGRRAFPSAAPAWASAGMREPEPSAPCRRGTLQRDALDCTTGQALRAGGVRSRKESGPGSLEKAPPRRLPRIGPRRTRRRRALLAAGLGVIGTCRRLASRPGPSARPRLPGLPLAPRLPYVRQQTQCSARYDNPAIFYKATSKIFEKM